MVKQGDKKQQCCKLLKRELSLQLQISGTGKFPMDKSRRLAVSDLLIAKDSSAFCESPTFNSITGEIWSLSHSFFLGFLQVDIYAGRDVKLPSFSAIIGSFH